MTITDVRTDLENLVQPDSAMHMDSHEWQRHVGCMQAIANDMQRPVHEIAELYHEVLMHLKASARISDYLPILVSKRVKQIYSRH